MSAAASFEMLLATIIGTLRCTCVAVPNPEANIESTISLFKSICLLCLFFNFTTKDKKKGETMIISMGIATILEKI